MDEQNMPQETLFSWQTRAFPHYERGTWWYIIAGIIGGALIVAAFLSGNFLLAVVVVMVGIVLLVQGSHHPEEIEVEITTAGVRRGHEFFPYRTIQKFWIIYDPPIQSLYLSIPKSLFPTVHFAIHDQDPNQIREHLKKFVKEDLSHDAEPVWDSISRILKI